MAIATKKRAAATTTKTSGVWSAEEHDKFLVGLKMFPDGPWKSIAEQVGTRSARQVQTHAQKYYEKVARRLRGLRKDRKKLVRPEHRLGEDMVSLCQAAAIDGSATPVATTDAPVRRGLNPVCAPAAVGSPMGVDSPVDDVDFDTLEPRERADSLDSLDSLLHDRANDDSEMELSDATDSGAEDSDALLEFDDYCLDYLLEILGSSDCAVDVAL